jgi:DGQHR domain-containing protein
VICSCCGFEIEGKQYSTDNGQKNVCEQCWNNPDMFFPEKINQDPRLSLLSKMAQETGKHNEIVEVTAIKLVQKEIEMYIGKMKITDILNLYELDKFKEEELEGYQRERYEERTSQLVEYLEKSPLAIMPALLVGLRETNFIPISDNIGTLRINRKKGAIWIIDGQHRVGGFSKIREQFMFTKKLGASLFTDLMDYELPVVFIDSEGAAEKIKSKGAKGTASLSAQDIEKTIFFVVNKTQRGISPSLKDALLYSIKTSGIEGLALVDKEGWRIIGAQIAITLNCKENSPLRAKINVSGQRNSGKPIQLNSFVSSLEILFKDKEFSNLSVDDKIGFIETYWSALREVLPEAFKAREQPKANGEEFGKRYSGNINKNAKKNQTNNLAKEKHLLLTSLAVYTMHRIARDLLHLAIRKSINFKQSESFKEVLEPLRSFDWKANSSPLSALGGMKGVSKAYELLTHQLNLEIDPESKSLVKFSP